MAAVRLSFTWLGVRRTLTHQQRSTAAGPIEHEVKTPAAWRAPALATGLRQESVRQ
ncbi:MAG: hypothetical protein ACI8P0_005185, partial [Planctomycetaceae bacterium]